MRRFPFAALFAALLLIVPAPAHASRTGAAEVRIPGTAVAVDPATGRVTVTVDDTVDAGRVGALRATGASVRREPGRLSTLVAAGDGVFSGANRCSVAANVRQGSTYYVLTAGHCVTAGATWYTGSSTVLGSAAGASFPVDDYGLIRYTNSLLPHPGAISTYPGTRPVTGYGTAVVGQAVCRSGSTTGVRCGTVTALNVTVNWAQGTTYGLIRTSICAEPGDSGGPLYVATTGVLLGILSGGSGNCTSGGVTYYQPIAEALNAYGVIVHTS